jgi:hypothetical protein
MGLVLGIEQQFGGEVVLDDSVIFDAIGAARRESSDLRVRHVVRALALAVTDRPKKILFDDEL